MYLLMYLGLGQVTLPSDNYTLSSPSHRIIRLSRCLFLGNLLITPRTYPLLNSVDCTRLP